MLLFGIVLYCVCVADLVENFDEASKNEFAWHLTHLFKQQVSE